MYIFGKNITDKGKMLTLTRMIPHIKEACLWLQTPQIREVKIFYNKIHSIISAVQNKSSPPLSKNIKIIFTSSSTPQTGITFIADKKPEEELQDPDGRPICFSSDTDSHETLQLNSEMANIFRCSSIETTKSFYEHYGVWNEEKHQNGPRHYSVNWNGVFTELYPQRKINAGLSEFIFQINNINEVFLKLKESNVSITSNDDKHISLSDPDGRLIKFIP